ncbi:hypothetical protein [Rhodopseudomonas sp. B29]|uniref:hypothetical protein n=1 Tax=Rhodopseudomonas sp. B29 TaxID=95607 RepID=UPI001AEC1038|nr:hypothetical protein [Rhodopseudomonas sp. B29]
MSDQAADQLSVANRRRMKLTTLSISVGHEVLKPSGFWCLRVPGCLTSEDEERETWTAKSLRVSIERKLRLSIIETGRKTSAVTRFKETPWSLTL